VHSMKCRPARGEPSACDTVRAVSRNVRTSIGAVLAVLALSSAACASESVESTIDTQASPSPTVVEPAVELQTTRVVDEPVSETSTTAPVRTALECAEEIPLEIRIGQLLFPIVVQAELDDAAALAEHGLIAGVVVLGSPTPAIADDIEVLQQRSMVTPSIVAVDEEGGRVQRLDELVGALPSARSVARDLTLEEAQDLAQSHAEAIGALGFTMNLAPVVDLDTGEFIRDRSYGADPDRVTDYAFATADGILAAGLTPVVKHFPGHGPAADSHTGLPTLPDLETLRSSDLVPFIRAIERGDLPVMVGHLVVPGLTNGKPATLSAEAIDGLLRSELGFDGLVMTDALNMDAIAKTTNNADAAEQALVAGADLVMLGRLADVETAVAQLVDAVVSGRLPEATVNSSVLRVLDVRGIPLCSLPADLLPAIGCRSGVGGCTSG